MKYKCTYFKQDPVLNDTHTTRKKPNTTHCSGNMYVAVGMVDVSDLKGDPEQKTKVKKVRCFGIQRISKSYIAAQCIVTAIFALLIFWIVFSIERVDATPCPPSFESAECRVAVPAIATSRCCGIVGCSVPDTMHNTTCAQNLASEQLGPCLGGPIVCEVQCGDCYSIDIDVNGTYGVDNNQLFTKTKHKDCLEYVGSTQCRDRFATLYPIGVQDCFYDERGVGDVVIRVVDVRTLEDDSFILFILLWTWSVALLLVTFLRLGRITKKCNGK